MKISSTTYVIHNDEILLINWRPYGPYCGVGGFLGEHGTDVLNTAQNTLMDLVGINSSDIDMQLVGRISFFDEDIQENNTSYIFRGNSSTKNIVKYPEVHSAKWIPISKVFNFKLFPNNERLYIKEVLEAKFFEIELNYAQGLVTKKVPVYIS